MMNERRTADTLKFLLVLAVLGLASLMPIMVFGQSSSNQVWSEYMANLPVGKTGNLEGAVTYSTDMGQPKWRALDFQLTPEWALSKRVDVMGALLFSSTFQSAALSTSEIREMIGTRIHFRPDKRFLLRMLVRFEQRNVRDRETDSWDHSTRSRFRLESIYPFNHPSIGSADKVWYGLADAESFVNFDKDVKERFANRFRFRLGLGYKFDHRFRAEFVYTLQASVNALEGGIDTHENIFRFRLKHYLQKRTGRGAEGTGN